MRQIIVALVCHDTNRICDLQGRDKHFVLANPQTPARHGARIPLAVIFFIVSSGVRNVATIFIGYINAQLMAVAERVAVFFPFCKPDSRIAIFRIVDRFANGAAKK